MMVSMPIIFFFFAGFCMLDFPPVISSFDFSLRLHVFLLRGAIFFFASFHELMWLILHIIYFDVAADDAAFSELILF